MSCSSKAQRPSSLTVEALTQALTRLSQTLGVDISVQDIEAVSL